uniref:Uncharacterized protein n=1 Tax=Siphoviridae sp. ctKXi8 TaxID=2826244 RepID=A0A8S5MY15_9CAUD|nr:MAG TPA: hypothetical protein [Siphoviridae sp. ctKXi8]
MIVCERINNKAPCKAVEALQGVFLCPDNISGPCAALCGLLQGLLLCLCWYCLQAAKNFN